MFFLINFTLNLVPLTYQIILFQTGTFWTSILAFCVFSEPIVRFEIIAMIICFAGMLTITLGSTMRASDDEATGVA